MLMKLIDDVRNWFARQATPLKIFIAFVLVLVATAAVQALVNSTG